MTAFSIDFEWFRCPDGYHLIPYGPKPMARIVASSDRADTYRPFDRFDSLYKEFAKVKTANDLLGFVKRFGLLAKGPEIEADFYDAGDGEYVLGGVIELEGNSVPKYLTEARLFREILLRKENGPKAVAAFFRSHKEFGGLGSAVTLVADPSTGIKLGVTVTNLIHGLKFQLARSLIGGTIVRACRFCGEFFEAGPGANVRSDATFCRPEHSVLYHSHKRSKGDR